MKMPKIDADITDMLEGCDAHEIREAIDYILENYWGELMERIEENGIADDVIEQLRD